VVARIADVAIDEAAQRNAPPTMRRLAGNNGTVVVMDERLADAFDPASVTWSD
jgi:hypothetical protein